MPDLCACGDALQLCGTHVEVDPSNPCLDCARIKHVLDIDIPAWQHGSGDWFTVMLIALIAKADPQNRERIHDGFPLEVEAFERWVRG